MIKCITQFSTHDLRKKEDSPTVMDGSVKEIPAEV